MPSSTSRLRNCGATSWRPRSLAIKSGTRLRTCAMPCHESQGGALPTATTSAPPGFRTRNISLRAIAGSGKWRSAKSETTTSKLAASNCSDSASIALNSIRSARPARRAFASAEASIFSDRSMPTQLSPTPAALAASRATTPVPVPISSTRWPEVMPAMAMIRAASGAVSTAVKRSKSPTCSS